MTFKHFLGDFKTLSDVWERYPSGGQEGDYLNIDGEIYRWNSIENQWTAPAYTVPGSARQTDNVPGDLNVENNLNVGGILRARVVRGRSASCGLFVDKAALTRHYPKPLVGQWALIMIENRTDEDGNAIGEVYVCEEEGVWKDAGYRGGLDGETDSYITEKEERKEGDAYLKGKIADLQNQIDGIQIHGMAVSNEFGDDPHIGISQKTLTESRDNLQSQIDAIINDNAQVELSASPSCVFVGEENEISLVATTNTEATSIEITGGDIQTPIEGSGLRLVGSDALNWPDAGDIIYQAVFAIGVLRKIVTKKVALVYPIKYGAGQDYTDAAEQATPRTSPAGTYQVAVDNDGDYVFFVVPATMTINRATMGGFEFPLQAAQNEIIDGVEYKYYQSANTYNEGVLTIVIS